MFDNIRDFAVELAKKSGFYQAAPVAVPQSEKQKISLYELFKNQPNTLSWDDKYKIKKSAYEQDPDSFLKGYRADNKTGKLENLPDFFAKRDFDPYVNAYVDSLKHGNYRLDPETMASMMFKEGRFDFGFNKVDLENASEKVKKIYQETLKNHPKRAAEFAAAIQQHKERADHTGLPFPMIWNGTGRAKDGHTGKQYAQEFEKFKQMIRHPKNKEALDYFRNKLTPQQRAELESLDYNDPFGDSIG